MRVHRFAKLAFAAVLVSASLASPAYADTEMLQAAAIAPAAASVDLTAGEAKGTAADDGEGLADLVEKLAAKQQEAIAAITERTDKVLPYDPALIEQIGNQLSSGHSICCPSFSCAYADAVLDGTVHDHSYYTCYCCTWVDWGGGGSAYRCVGTDEQLLREAYDQISEGKPTVIHVIGPYGEHWIALIGYVGAADPDHLTLDNFIALDPANGAQIVASEKYVLYGDGCEHVSERANN